MTKLKPCPFCGSDDIEITRQPEFDDSSKVKVGRCMDCGTYGPWTNNNADELWNKRVEHLNIVKFSEEWNRRVK
jgi:Lar family restriction alleviation protein